MMLVNLCYKKYHHTHRQKFHMIDGSNNWVQAVFIIVEFLYSKGIWQKTTQFVLAEYDLLLEPNSGPDWTVDGMQDQPWRIDAMQVCLQIQLTRNSRNWLILFLNTADCNYSLAKSHIGVFTGNGQKTSLTHMPEWSDLLFLRGKHVLGWKSTLDNLVTIF